MNSQQSNLTMGFGVLAALGIMLHLMIAASDYVNTIHFLSVSGWISGAGVAGVYLLRRESSGEGVIDLFDGMAWYALAIWLGVLIAMAMRVGFY